MPTPETTFTPFRWDANQYFAYIDSPEALAKLRVYYPVNELKKAKICEDETGGAAPYFGYRREHRGEQTLGEWAESVGLDLAMEA